MMNDAKASQSSSNNNNHSIEYESESSEDSYMQNVVSTAAEAISSTTEGTRNLPYTRNTIEKFMDSLRFNLIFDVGFSVQGHNPDDEKSCFCPCSKIMKKWRSNFSVEFMIDKDECQGYHQRATPKGLMDHIRKVGTVGGYLHRGVELYLTHLYVSTLDCILAAIQL